jgi:hypothetical protein
MPTELLSLSKIFNNRLFRIPDYQRGFAWGERQLSDFWSDLLRVGADRTHYCGQLTLEKVAEETWHQWADDSWLIEEADYDPNFVVDGQQRLTTSVILLQCLLEGLPGEQLLAGQSVQELRQRYLAKKKGELLASCLFGYARDNPSHEFFRTKILGVPSNEYHGVRTVYTANLAAARDFFLVHISKVDETMRERLFKALTQRFRFNVHELNDDIDVFVAFETMNNRGKPLTRLELLKNRLIYLSTLAPGTESEPEKVANKATPEQQKVRANVNAVWRTVYEELGRNPEESLDDDEFLRAHWILFFGYDKEEADPLTRFLLNWHFTTERLDKGQLKLTDIQKYADSLQTSSRYWQRLHFPEQHEQDLGKEVAAELARLKRLGFGVLKPLLLAVLTREGNATDICSVLQQAERFLLLVRSLGGARSNVGETESYRMANDLHKGTASLTQAATMLKERVSLHFTPDRFQAEIDELFADDDGKGYYDLAGLKYILFEYEESLRIEAKATTGKISWNNFRGAKNSVEHVYPQNPTDNEWPAFSSFSTEQRRQLCHSLGNLVAVSVAKNASLSRRAFAEKVKGTAESPGFSQGSFSELRIAQSSDWTPKTILERGVEMLKFIEQRWSIQFGNRSTKVDLLKLEFIEPNSIFAEILGEEKQTTI